jgi:hypothetical protein
MSNPFIEGFLDEFIKIGGGMMRALRLEKSIAKTVAKKGKLMGLTGGGKMMGDPIVAKTMGDLNKRERALRSAKGVAEERSARSVVARAGKPGGYPRVDRTRHNVPTDDTGLSFAFPPVQSEASALQRRMQSTKPAAINEARRRAEVRQFENAAPPPMAPMKLRPDEFV